MKIMVKGMLATIAVLPGTAFAQADDAGYCRSLTSTYQRYVASAQTGHNPTLPPVEVENAIAQCQGGNPQAGIPVLEQKLRDARIDLPARAASPGPVKVSK